MNQTPWHQNYIITLFVIPIILSVAFTLLSPMISSWVCNSKKNVMIEGHILKGEEPIVGANVMVQRVAASSTNEQGKFYMEIPTQESRYKVLGCTSCDRNTNISFVISYQEQNCTKEVELHNEALNDDTLKLFFDFNNMCE